MKKVLTGFGLVVLMAGCATVPFTGRKQLSFIPQTQLISMSFSNYQELLKESTLSQDRDKVAMVRRVGDRLVTALEQFMRDKGMSARIEDYQWEFNLIEDDKQVNAFAMPGGKVAVYTGLLPVSQDENGLAAVLSHEIAHAVANHGGERMSQMLLVSLGGVSLNQALRDKPAKTRNMWLLAYGAGATLGAVLPYSRKHESEADHIGLIIMAMAGYDPRTAVGLWERMAAQGGSKVPEFLSTHPTPATRIEQIRAELPEAMGYYEKQEEK